MNVNLSNEVQPFFADVKEVHTYEGTVLLRIKSNAVTLKYVYDALSNDIYLTLLEPKASALQVSDFERKTIHEFIFKSIENYEKEKENEGKA